MKIKLPTYLEQDLIEAAIKRKIPTQDFIIQILSTGMLVEKHISLEDNEKIMAIYKKYLQ